MGPLGFCCTALLLVLACGEDDEPKACVTGTERCACYGNDTCDPGLACYSHLCVNETDGGRTGTGGAGGVPGSTPGNAGAGGVVDVPPGSGGSSGIDAGGNTGTDPTSGGSAGDGAGAPSRGGGASTGGASTASGGATVASGGTLGSAGQPGTGEAGSPGLPEGTLISNGDFSAGNADWNLTLQLGGAGVSTFTNGHACIQGNPSVAFDFGWPSLASKAFVLEPGVPYTLSFRAVAGSPFTLIVKLGHVTTPYTAAYLTNTSLTTGWASYSFNVVAASGDSAAGLVFQGTLLSGNSVCFDDVSLVKN